MFKKILIANRGEIACRVIKTARRMGIATVAVYSEADRDALYVELADEAVAIGAAASRESYLSIDKIIAACKQTGAEAVHPGYGFLSENAEFARRVEEEGIVFIGPKHASIAAMGDKIASKKLAAAAKVSHHPRPQRGDRERRAAVEIAKRIGYPVMIKASAGGGGKGLRVAYDDAQAKEGFASCRNEAKAASATTASSSRSSSSSRATSRSRSSATRTATASTSGSASARSSAGTRRWWRRRPARSSTTPRARRWASRRSRWPRR